MGVGVTPAKGLEYHQLQRLGRSGRGWAFLGVVCALVGSLVIVPALAVDRRGVRLGRGRGFYDRSLDGRNPKTRLIAMVRDVEFVDELPADPHDVPMTHALTPRRGLVALFPDGE